MLDLFWPAQHMPLWSSDTHLQHPGLLLFNTHAKSQLLAAQFIDIMYSM